MSVSGDISASYTYAADGLLAEETAGGAATTFTWDRCAGLPQVLTASQGSAFVYGLGLLAQQQDGAWTYPLPDGLGSLRQWLDARGDVLSAAGYAPVGAPAWQRGVAPAAWGFAGEYHDPAGLLYLRARWYAPQIGRFLTRDPFPGLAMLPETQHPYAYAGNNPVLYTDPSGEFLFIPLLLVALAGGMLGGTGYYAIQAYQQADPCTGMRWDWNQALFWSGIGGGIGAALGLGIYGGWWAWTTVSPAVGPIVYAKATSLVSDPLTPGQKVDYRRQMYQVFLRANPSFRQFVGSGQMSMHHRIPLQWAHLFPNADPNRLPNLYAISPSIHNEITTAWNAFARSNPAPTAADVVRFAIQMDQEYAQYVNRIPW